MGMTWRALFADATIRGWPVFSVEPFPRPGSEPSISEEGTPEFSRLALGAADPPQNFGIQFSCWPYSGEEVFRQAIRIQQLAHLLRLRARKFCRKFCLSSRCAARTADRVRRVDRMTWPVTSQSKSIRDGSQVPVIAGLCTKSDPLLRA